MHVSFDEARRAIEGACKKAEEIDTKMCIAVVDSGGNLKAKTALFFAMPTGQIGELSQPGGPLFGIEHSNEGLITFPGGIPIVDKDGVMVGGIGVSGSSVDNDQTVAKAGVQVLGEWDLPEHPW